jgi:hypothetical protein
MILHLSRRVINQKLIVWRLGTMWEEKLFIYLFIFLIGKWTTYYTSFPTTPSMSNSNTIWARGEFLFKMGCKFIFLVFLQELLYATMLLKLPKG